MTRHLTAFSLLLACIMVCCAAANASPAVDETQKTAAAVLAVDQHWSRAEISGDVTYIDALLLPEYRSVSPDGAVAGKSEILSHARANGSHAAQTARLVAHYHQTHPYGTQVTISGNTALLTFYSKTLGPQKGVLSCDMFVYQNGRWHALYSQHTTASK